MTMKFLCTGWNRTKEVDGHVWHIVLRKVHIRENSEVIVSQFKTRIRRMLILISRIQFGKRCIWVKILNSKFSENSEKILRSKSEFKWAQRTFTWPRSFCVVYAICWRNKTKEWLILSKTTGDKTGWCEFSDVLSDFLIKSMSQWTLCFQSPTTSQ